MKPQFATKKNKAKKSKAAKKAARKAAANDGDTAMVQDGGSEEIDYTMPENPDSAKQRHKGKLELKSALKAKMKQLKVSRNKLTKLPGAAGAKQETKQIKQKIKAIKVQVGGKKKVAQGAAKAAAKPQEGTMEQ